MVSTKVTLFWRKNECGCNSQPGNYLLPEAKIFLRSMVASTVNWKEQLMPKEIYIPIYVCKLNIGFLVWPSEFFGF